MNKLANEILKKRAEELKIEKRFFKDYNEENTSEYFILAFSDSIYAIAMEDIFEITELSESIPLPCSADYLLGIVNLRGEIIPLFDISSFLGINSSDKKSDYKIAVLNSNDSFAGIIVDEVLEKYQYKEETILQIDSSKKGNTYINGAITWQNKSLPLLDIKKLMSEHKLLSKG